MKKKQDNKVRQSLWRVIRNNAAIVLKAIRYTPEYVLLVVVNAVVYGLLSSAEAVFTVRLFDALDASAPFSEAARIIGLMALFYVIAYVYTSLYWSYWHPLLRRKLELKLHTELFEKVQTLDVACYDDPQFYNDFVWSMDEASKRVFDIIGDMGALIRCCVTASTLFTLMFSIDLWLSLLLIGASALTVVINQIGNKIDFENQKEWNPQKRIRNYLNRVFHLPDYAKEIRLSHMLDLLLDQKDQNIRDMNAVSIKYGKKNFVLYGIGNTLLSNGIYFGVMFYMFFKLLAGTILIGAFAAAVGMIWRVRWILQDFVERATKFPKHSLFLEKYYGFLSYEPNVRSGEREVDAFESLELRDVSFTYDFSDKPRYAFHDKDHKAPKSESGNPHALENVSLSLRRGEKIAIVGYNGAGKTTLIKLLMRLYDPTAGQVLWNGVDAREYDLEAYRRRIGVVFQDFKIFAASIAENVMNGRYEEATDKDTVLRALHAADFDEKLASLEGGVDTVLTREFDPKGTNLSGGESQKIAIARVFAKPFEVIIMDEPSSALDPLSEYNLNQSILEYAADKTVIFISHRLSTTRMADRIYMFDSGGLIEHGSHDELMARGGKYAEMFTLQASKYAE